MGSRGAILRARTHKQVQLFTPPGRTSSPANTQTSKYADTHSSGYPFTLPESYAPGETESDPWTLACLHRLETVSRSDSHTRAAQPAQRQQALLPSWLCPPTSPASSPSRQRTPHLRALLRQRRGHRARVPAPASLRCCRDPRARGTRPPAGYSSHPSQVRWGQADSGQTLAPPRPCPDTQAATGSRCYRELLVAGSASLPLVLCREGPAATVLPPGRGFQRR